MNPAARFIPAKCHSLRLLMKLSSLIRYSSPHGYKKAERTKRGRAFSHYTAVKGSEKLGANKNLTKEEKKKLSSYHLSPSLLYAFLSGWVGSCFRLKFSERIA